MQDVYSGYSEFPEDLALLGDGWSYDNPPVGSGLALCIRQVAQQIGEEHICCIETKRVGLIDGAFRTEYKIFTKKGMCSHQDEEHCKRNIFYWLKYMAGN